MRFCCHLHTNFDRQSNRNGGLCFFSLEAGYMEYQIMLSRSEAKLRIAVLQSLFGSS